MKEYIVVIDPFIADQQIYEIVDNQLKMVTSFQLTKMESYAPLFEILNQTKDENITINLKCPKIFRDKVKEKIYAYLGNMNFEQNNLIIKDIIF